MNPSQLYAYHLRAQNKSGVINLRLNALRDSEHEDGTFFAQLYTDADDAGSAFPMAGKTKPGQTKKEIDAVAPTPRLFSTNFNYNSGAPDTIRAMQQPTKGGNSGAFVPWPLGTPEVK